MILQSNATLTAVTRGGRTEEPGASAPTETTGDAVFEGTVRAYYTERRERLQSSTGRDTFLRRTLIVDTREPPIEFLTGDVVTFTRDRGGPPVVAEVEMASARELGELAGSGVETTRVDLRPRR